jgi:poly(A) polymerase
MTPIAPRKPQRPFTWPDIVLELQEILADSNTPVYVVGGAVRDAYLHRPIHDLDLATPRDAIKLGRLVADRLRGAFYILDYERDVARVLIQPAQSPERRLVVDIARFRGDDLLADLVDRDFTFNAMATDLCADLTQIIDPLNGEQDLVNRIVRQCGPQAISDDPIRALRAVRQSVQFEARIEPKTLTNIRHAGPMLVAASPERLRDELFKLLQVSRPGAAIRVADRLGLLHAMLPELRPLHSLALPEFCFSDGWEHTLTVVERLHGLLAIFNALRSEDDTSSFSYGAVATALGHLRSNLEAHISTMWPNERMHRGLLVLAALLHRVGAAAQISGEFPNEERAGDLLAQKRATALRLSNDEKDRIAAIVRYHDLVRTMDINDLEMHRFWQRLGEAGVDICLLAMAKYLAMTGIEIDHGGWIVFVERVQKLLDAYYNRYEQIVAPPPLLDGNQLMNALSLAPGKHIGRLLDIIREGQVTGEITTVDEALDTARADLTEGGL